MKRYTKEELNEILKKHQHWLDEDCDNWECMRADLSYANLSHMDLRSTDLSYANLSYAYLRYADLSNANLSNANLNCANLSNANLRNANLSSAYLHCANLSNADLSNANLSNANLSNANLSNTNLNNAKNIPFIPYACPDTGSFIGYKKAGNYIVELKILSDARRCSATGRKCRCDRAEVLSIQYIDKTPCDDMKVASDYNKNFIYRVGEIVEEPNFDENRWNECSKGIHFFINRQEAVEY